jgi:hypothetical protein
MNADRVQLLKIQRKPQKKFHHEEHEERTEFWFLTQKTWRAAGQKKAILNRPKI